MELDVNLTIPTWYDNLIKVPSFEASIIAGGFLRDQVLAQVTKTDFKPKDIDVFIPLGMRATTDHVIDLTSPSGAFITFLTKEGFSLSSMDWSYSRRHYSSEMIAKVRIFWPVQDIYVEFCFIKETIRGFGRRYIDSFPVNLQQICIDRGDTHMSPAFVDGVTRKCDIGFNEIVPSPLFKIEHIEDTTSLTTIIEKYNRLHKIIPHLRFSLGDYHIVRRKWDEVDI